MMSNPWVKSVRDFMQITAPQWRGVGRGWGPCDLKTESQIRVSLERLPVSGISIMEPIAESLVDIQIHGPTQVLIQPGRNPGNHIYKFSGWTKDELTLRDRWSDQFPPLVWDAGSCPYGL